MTDAHTEASEQEPDRARYETIETAGETIIYDVENQAAWVSSDAVVPLADAQ